MKNTEIAGRLRDLARKRPTHIWWELHSLAVELEQAPPEHDVPARDAQSSAAPHHPPAPPVPRTGLRLVTQTARTVGLVALGQLDARYLDTRSRRHAITLLAILLAFVSAAFGLSLRGTP